MPRHHTVPEVYLKGFYDQNMIAKKQHVLWLYEEDRRKPVPRGADAVGFVPDFNTEPEWTGNENLAEELYTKLDTAVPPVLQKLRAGDPRLTADEKGVMAFFLCFQKFRTTVYRDTVNAAAIDGFRHTCRQMLEEGRAHEIVGTTEAERSGEVKFTLEDAEKFLRDNADGTIALEQTGKGWSIQGAILAGYDLSPDIHDMHWTLCEAPASSPFITTDNPVALFDPIPGRIEGRTGGPLFQFIWPVSPRFLMFGERRGSGPDDRGRISAEMAETWNDELIKVAHKQVYASLFSKELQTRINRTFKEREPLITPLPADYRG
jgi:hypothetical protein